MIQMSADAFETLVNNASVLEHDSFGPKVLRLEDGSFFKLFRRKRLFSSEAYSPYASRFANNARLLRDIGIPTPEVLEVYRISEPSRTAVHYMGLPGITLRQAMLDSNEPERDQLAERFGQLLGKLHENGIYFRSLHLGNVLLLPDGQLGLIDFADLHAGRGKLSDLKRKRNSRHMQRYEQDRIWLFEQHSDALQKGYQAIAGHPLLGSSL
ncbi:hypothetical protein EA797_02525 [Stutzerimonas zhaodongensis]|uniref:Aminoglycoside phosphotransferase domain-containing protein n=1 Tax=Stutzerimonas zhaodongensis TaxID=1176257 RepID=A0A3M2HTN6_9GAMM|nr:phosphotransferase [Stutzerimonas zhaodongensis]MCQ4315481.1 hypothetical protein [Stutzerimonas zhaodongensis]RMH91645.1 hypothetical protein EA797_02525 [Stutzerimonas zhaodongensis]